MADFKSRPELVQDNEDDRDLTIHIPKLAIVGKPSASGKSVVLAHRRFHVDVEGLDEIATVAVTVTVPHDEKYVDPEAPKPAEPSA